MDDDRIRDMISVIVSVYNMDSVLPQALYCISNQTYRDLEIILVDDGSTDSSGRICDDFARVDSRAKVIHKENGGQSSAKNAGMDAATGDYFFFPDADDIFNLDILRLMHEAITREPDCDLVISGMEMVEDWDLSRVSSSQSEGTLKFEILSKDDLVRGLFAKGDSYFLYGWNKLYRRNLLRDIRFGDYPRHQDFDFNLRSFLHVDKAVLIDASLYYWVQWGGSKTHQPNSFDLFYECRASILYFNWTGLTDRDAKYEPLLLEALYKTMIFWEEWSRKSGNFREVRTRCDGYVGASRSALLKVKGLSMTKKVICLVLLAFPGFSHFMMKITSNAR